MKYKNVLMENCCFSWHPKTPVTIHNYWIFDSEKPYVGLLCQVLLDELCAQASDMEKHFDFLSPDVLLSKTLTGHGYVMSLRQLNELWHYDLWLGHILMDLPLRSCSAIPTESLSCRFPPMNDTELQELKKEIRSMWIFASHHFKCQKSNLGWGLFFSENFGSNGNAFTSMKPAIMGWLVKVPSANECPTGHRYLRSPCAGKDNIYLGGPISMANFDPVDRVSCRSSISLNKPWRFKMVVYKAAGRRVIPGSELLWSYNLNTRDENNANFYHQNEWQQDSCCSEVEKNAFVGIPSVQHKDVDCQSSSTLPMSHASTSHQPCKKRKVGGYRPLKTAACVNSYKFCTYCGENLAATTEKGKKENMKRHWALKHAAELCSEMGAELAEEENPISSKSFMLHLDKVDHVYNSLNNHNYKITPACHFFKVTDTPLLDPEASCEEKQTVYSSFLSEGRKMFSNYQVLYLKGISIPQNYQDLLPPEKETNYSDINWLDTQPSTNNFSVVSFDLSEDENQEHALDIQASLTNAVLGWMEPPSTST